MSIEAKLDQIIELLTRIESKLSADTQSEAPAVKIFNQPKPTKAMLKFQHMIEFAASMDRTFFLSRIRNAPPNTWS